MKKEPRSKVMALKSEREIAADSGMWLTHPGPFGTGIKLKKGLSTNFKL